MKNAIHMITVGLLAGFALSASAATSEASTATPDPRWMEQVQQNLTQREYHASVTDRGLQAPNRAQGFRSLFDADGVRVEEREGSNRGSLAGIHLSAVGRGESLVSVGAGKVSHSEQRVEIARDGITEWFENRPEGLEQGFVLARRPGGTGDLRVQLDVSGAIARSTGDSVELQSWSGKRMRYGKLAVWDATGLPIKASMVAEGRTVTLVAKDANAIYPLTIDPLLSMVADTLLESNQSDSDYGYSVASAGDVNGDGFADVIVGAQYFDNGQNSEGAAFVYHGSPTGILPGIATQLEIDVVDARFGNSVAGAGDVNGDGFADVIISGLATSRVYYGSAGGIATSGATTLAVGGSNAGAGDVNGDGYADVIVGSPIASFGQGGEGAAYIFHGSALGISTVANIRIESNQEDAELGYSVAGAGDVNGDGFADVIIGAHFYSNGEQEEGVAFVHHGSSSGVSASYATLLESNQIAADFGSGVSSAGDVNGDGYADVIVGAPTFHNGELNEGAAYVFLGGAAGVSTAANAQMESNQAGAMFGLRVGGGGDLNGDGFSDVVVGAERFANGQASEGAAFVYYGSASGIDTTAAARVESDQVNAYLGSSVAIAGDVNGDGFADLIVGAQSFANGQANEGGAFVYHGGGLGIVSNAIPNRELSVADIAANQDANYGWAVAGAGDVNGDGFDDVAVAARYFDNGQTDEGAVFVYHGGPAGVALLPSTQLEENQTLSDYGYSVAAAGDVNGDGYGDLVVGAREFSDGAVKEGKIFFYSGSADGIGSMATSTFQINQPGAHLGNSVAGAGDINGDGYADVVVGASDWDITTPSIVLNVGAAYVLRGSPVGLSSVSSTTLTGTIAQMQLGSDVAGAGDVNGDGFADVIVGASGYTNPQTAEGAVFIHHGSSSGLNSSPATSIESNQANSGMGNNVASAGDVNGDGYADILIGVPNFDNPENNEGAVFIHHGGPGGVSNVAATQIEGNQGSAAMGAAVASAGDINGDGYSDVVLGAPSMKIGGYTNRGGAAFVHLGSALGISSTASTVMQPTPDETMLFGTSVAGAGDVNGDGFADIIIGACRYDSPNNTDVGAAFIYHGNTEGHLVQASQSRADSLVPVQNWGLSYDETSFWVSMQVTSPRGRENVKLQVEACPPGMEFGGVGCEVAESPTWTELGSVAEGITLPLPVTGLVDRTQYHWRARSLHAPLHFITAPTNPAHGPWRRLSAAADVADVLAGVPPGILTITPGTLDFGDVLAGTASGEYTVTLGNIGTDYLAVGTLTAPSAPFGRTLTGSCSMTLPIILGPGDTCTLTYTFEPEGAGAFMQTLSVRANAQGSGTIELIGTGLEGYLVISPVPLDFGDQGVGTSSGVRYITLSNTGSAALDINTLEAPLAPFEQQGGDCEQPINIAAGQSCTLGYVFSPTAPTGFNQLLEVTPNSPGDTGILLHGNGIFAGVLSASPGVVDFGNQPVNFTSDFMVVTLSNTGSLDLSVDWTTLFPTMSEFALVAGGTCGDDINAVPNAPFSIAANGGSCTLHYTFTPSAPTGYTQPIKANAGAAGEVSFTLIGNGVLSGVLQISPEIVDFGNQVLNQESSPMTVTLTNIGSGSLSVTSLTAAVLPFAHPQVGGTCAKIDSGLGGQINLGMGESCTMLYTFTPQTEGPAVPQVLDLHVSATVSDDQTITLMGNGVAQGQLVVSPTTLDFGDQPVNTTSVGMTVTLSNTGTAALVATLSPILHDPSSPFTLTNDGTCVVDTTTGNVSIGVSASCTLIYTFKPTSVAPSTQDVSISTDARGSDTITLTGNGVAGGALTINPSSIDFGTWVVGTTSGARTVTLTNGGSGSVTVTVDPATAPFNTDDACSSIPAGESCVLTYTFTPTALADVSQTLGVLVDGGSGGGSFELMGSGTDETAIFKDGFEDPAP